MKQDKIKTVELKGSALDWAVTKVLKMGIRKDPMGLKIMLRRRHWSQKRPILYLTLVPVWVVLLTLTAIVYLVELIWKYGASVGYDCWMDKVRYVPRSFRFTIRGALAEVLGSR